MVMNINGYTIDVDTLRNWGRRLIPEVEWFYFADDYDSLPMESMDSLDYSQVPIDLRTSYATWGIRKNARFYSKVAPELFVSLEKETQDDIVRQQWELGRGLLFTLEDLCELLQVPTLDIPATTLDTGEEIILLHRVLWYSLSEKTQFTFLLNYGALWIDEQSIWKGLSAERKQAISNQAPHLQRLIDTFSFKNGPNCFAAVATAVTKIQAYKDQWMQGEDLLLILERAEYSPVDTTEYKQGNVFVWFNQHKQPIHAAYVLTGNYVFNKHGQTMFNPWQILKIEDVLASWGQTDTSVIIFRR
ncbi:hypothetical protein [Rossellomorea aquimaris]|uniref:hypothetical protein n=1 Tax=Rossellomorea aquimaris TaxID=189382 RepID=UPI00249421F1|nr:hypothetical protein [Rossellomorea aquimaris]